MRLPSVRRLLFERVGRNDEGFTLLEVLVALTILGISLSVLLTIFSQGLERARDNRESMAARVLAQSLLARTNAAADSQPGQMNGQGPEGLSCHVLVTPYGSRGDPADAPFKAATISATVTWQEHGHGRSLTLDTLRLLPADTAH